MTWDAFPWIVEVIGVVIVIVWTLLPLREFVGIYRRMTAPPLNKAATQEASAESEEASV